MLLTAVLAPDAPVWLREVPAVAALRRVWVQQFYWSGQFEPIYNKWFPGSKLPKGQTFLAPF